MSRPDSTEAPADASGALRGNGSVLVKYIPFI